MNNQQPLSLLQSVELYSRTPLTPRWKTTNDKLENGIRICVSNAVWGAVAAAAGRYWFAIPLRYGFPLYTAHALGMLILFRSCGERSGLHHLLYAADNLAFGLLMKRLRPSTSYVEALGTVTLIAMTTQAALLLGRAALWLAGQDKSLTTLFTFDLVNVS